MGPDTRKIDKRPKARLFIHIPKNAGVAAMAAARKAGYFGFEFGDGKKVSMPDGNRCYELEMPPGLLGFPENGYQAALDQGNNTYCIKRNPYTRIVSEYRYV